MVPGWPYSVVAALETGRTSWTAVLDAVRLEPGADVAAVTTLDGTVRETYKEILSERSTPARTRAVPDRPGRPAPCRRPSHGWR